MRGVVNIVQIDICDGSFVPSQSWPYTHGNIEADPHFNKILNETEGLPFWEDLDFELDLMVSDSVKNFDIYTKLGAKRIVFHLCAVGNLQEFKDFLEGIDIYVRETIEIGVSIDVNENLENLFPLINNIDFVQCMGIDREGFQGEDFDEKVIDNVKALREKFPDLIISIDGGVDFDSAPQLLGVGASRLVIGSAIFNSTDIIGTIEEFRNIN